VSELLGGDIRDAELLTSSSTWATRAC